MAVDGVCILLPQSFQQIFAHIKIRFRGPDSTSVVLVPPWGCTGIDRGFVIRETYQI
jgi:hypothetical protein